VLVIEPQHGPHRKDPFQQLFYCFLHVCCRHYQAMGMFAESFLAMAISTGFTILAFSRHATVFQILMCYSSLTYSVFNFLRLKLSVSNFCIAHLLMDNLLPSFFLSKYYDYQRGIIIIIISSERSNVKYMSMLSPIYQGVIYFYFCILLYICIYLSQMMAKK
jgi:hypothetical protein